MPRITLSRRPDPAPSARTPRPTWRERREERELFARIASRPQTVRDELLEMLSRAG